MLSSLRKAALLLLTLFTALGFSGFIQAPEARAADALELYTPYVDWSAAPGETVSYSIELINHSSSTLTADITLDQGGNNWESVMTAGGRDISKLAVKPDESQTISLQLEVPLQVDKGRYTFTLRAGQAVLPLVIQVSEQGTFNTELSVDQANMEGYSDSSFTYSAVLRNRTSTTQTYALTAQAPSGWDVRFKSDGTSVTSVEVEPNTEKSISIEVKPAEMVQADTYTIPIAASSGDSMAQAELEAVITGTYGMELTTSNNLLSADIQSGGTRKLDFVVHNTGTAELQDLSFSANAPTGWEVSFSPSTITSIAPGESKPVQATIKSSNKSLAGDYVVSVTANSSAKSASADLRITVESSVIWGWIGVLIILAVVAGIYYLFRKFGRR